MRGLLFGVALSCLTAGGAAAMTLGVNTHFDQGWPVSAMEQAKMAGATGIRDTISWGKVEQSPGHYAFTPANSGYVATACQRGLSVLLTLTPRNRIYDNGETIWSPEGRQAFARFAAEVTGRFPCVTALEIGNEINGHSLKGRITADIPRAYIAIVAAVRDAVKPRHPDIALLSGSSLSVATGFFADLAQGGLLPLVDGIVVHPYNAVPEELPAQLARLNRLMTTAGAAKPVWASEFGFYYATPEAAPPHALKMITILDAAGIHRADWYALLDEPYYPNMGLFARGGVAKPALDSYRLATGRLLPAGQARRIDMGDALSFVYRFGNGPYVLWGAARTLHVRGAARTWDARGRAIALPAMIGDQPIMVEAPGGIDLGERQVLADSMTGFSASSWSRMVEAPGGRSEVLDWIDWNWSPYLGTRNFPNFRAMVNIVTTAHAGATPPRSLVERYTPTESGTITVSACFEGPAARPQMVTIRANGQSLWSQSTQGGPLRAMVPVQAKAGQPIEISYMAQTPGGPQSLRRRIRILSGPSNSAPLCATTDGQRASPQGGLATDPDQ